MHIALRLLLVVPIYLVLQLLTPIDANPVSMDDLKSRVYLPLALVLAPSAVNSVVYSGAPRIAVLLASGLSLSLLWFLGAIPFLLDVQVSGSKT